MIGFTVYTKSKERFYCDKYFDLEVQVEVFIENILKQKTVKLITFDNKCVILIVDDISNFVIDTKENIEKSINSIRALSDLYSGKY